MSLQIILMEMIIVEMIKLNDYNGMFSPELVRTQTCSNTLSRSRSTENVSHVMLDN